MSDIAKIVGTLVLVVVAVLGLSWVVQGNDFFIYKTFAPLRANVEREVFENTNSYKRGSIQNLQRMQGEYITADAEHKGALASLILQEAADFPEEEMPSGIRAFINQLRRERGLAQ